MSFTTAAVAASTVHTDTGPATSWVVVREGGAVARGLTRGDVELVHDDIHRELACSGNMMVIVHGTELGSRGLAHVLDDNDGVLVDGRLAYEALQLAYEDARAYSKASPLTCATDASVKEHWAGPHRKVVAATAWACADGRRSAKVLENVTNVNIAELIAVARVLRDHPAQQAPQALSIVTDSAWAVEQVETMRAGRTDRPGQLSIGEGRQYAELSLKMRKLFSSREFTLSWTKGHAGHPLNEIANDAARNKRMEVGFAFTDKAVRRAPVRL